MADAAETDVDLITRWRGGDAAAGQTLLGRHFTPLYRFFANKLDADVDELVQSTLTACLNAREQFRAEASFRTYLFTIARHQLYRYLRKRRADDERLDFSTTSVAQLVTTPGTRMDRDAAHRRLVEALRQLPVDQQTLIELYYWEDLEIAELAEIFEAPSGTIRVWLHRARKALRDRLGDEVASFTGRRSDETPD